MGVKIPKLKVGDLIEIIWNDAWSISSWTDEKNQLENAKLEVKSIGYFQGISKDKYLLLSGDFVKEGTSRSGRLGGRPIGMISKIRKVR